MTKKIKSENENIAAWLGADGDLSGSGLIAQLKEVSNDIFFLERLERGLSERNSRKTLMRAIHLMKNKRTFIESIVNKQ